jgi:Ni/Co efflux regulator RcnB
MKKLLVCLTLAAFAALTSAQAAEPSSNSKSCCSEQTKTSVSASNSKSDCTAKTSTSSCCSGAKVAKKNTAIVKGAVLLAGR